MTGESRPGPTSQFKARALWLVSICLAAAILVFSLVPVAGTSTGEAAVPHADKLMHFASYAALSFFLSLAVVVEWAGTERTDGNVAWVPYFAAAFIAFVYGVMIERLQGFVPGRSASALDALVNLLGSAIGALAASLKLKK